jgi:protein-tyrosine-phosphatase
LNLNRIENFFAQKVAAEYDVDLFGHTAKSVKEDIVDRSDLILVMENFHAKNILDAFPEAEDKVFLIRRFARFGSKDRGVEERSDIIIRRWTFIF